LPALSLAQAPADPLIRLSEFARPPLATGQPPLTECARAVAFLHSTISKRECRLNAKTGALVRSYADRATHLIVRLSLLATIFCMPTVKPAQGLTNDIPHQIKRFSVDGFVNAVAWNADGSRLAILSDFGGTVTVFDAKTWNEIRKFKRYGGAYAGNSFELLPNGNFITSTRIGKSPEPSDVSGNKVLGAVNTFSVSPDGAAAAAIHQGVTMYDLRSGHPLWQVLMPRVSEQMGDGARSLTFTPDAQRLIVGTMMGRLNVFRVQDGTLLRTTTLFEDGLYNCSQVALSSDGQLVAVGKNKNINVPKPTNISVFVFRLSDGNQISRLPGATAKIFGADEAVPVRALAWKPRTNVLAVGDDESLHIWRISRGGASQLLNLNLHGVYSLKYSPMGTLAVGYGSQVAIFE
jgi:WD40 repeat protein